MKSILFLAILVIVVVADLVPSHVYLSLTGDLSEMQVTFTTSSSPVNPSVKYWASSLPSKTTVIVGTTIHKFTHPSTGTVDYISSITIPGLVRGSEYGYFVSGEDGVSSSASPIFNFSSLPEDDAILRMGLYGDLGAYGYALEEEGKGGLVPYAIDGKFDVIMHYGDLAYNLATDSGSIGEKFMTNIEPLTSIVPYMVCPGNHEFMDDGDDQLYFNNWWVGQSKIGSSSASKNPFGWFSFDVGSKVHFIAISTEVYCEDTDNIRAQYEWLENDLATVRARSVAPWVIVFGHRQIYMGTSSTLHSRLMRLGLQCTNSTLSDCDATKPCKSGKDCGFSIEQLFEKYHVDMYFAGHEHTYVRMFPIAPNGTYETQNSATYINPRHTTYIVSGAAGTQSAPSAERQSQIEAGPSFITNSAYSFSVLYVYNNTYLHLEQIGAEGGSVEDTFAIVKNNEKPAWASVSAFALSDDNQTVCDQ